MDLLLNHVKKTYKVWGKYPFLYKLACIITFLGQENYLRKTTVEKLNLKPGDTVLDLACGTGLNFPFIEKRIGETGKIIAFDFSEEMLEAARKRAEKNEWRNIEFIQGDAAKLHLKEKIDGALSTLGISAIPDYKKALENAVKTLKPSGRISILDASLPSGFWKIFNPLVAFVYKSWASWDYTKDIPTALSELIPNTKIWRFNGGTIYIACGTRTAGQN